MTHFEKDNWFPWKLKFTLNYSIATKLLVTWKVLNWFSAQENDGGKIQATTAACQQYTCCKNFPVMTIVLVCHNYQEQIQVILWHSKSLKNIASLILYQEPFNSISIFRYFQLKHLDFKSLIPQLSIFFLSIIYGVSCL